MSSNFDSKLARKFSACIFNISGFGLNVVADSKKFPKAPS